MMESSFILITPENLKDLGFEQYSIGYYRKGDFYIYYSQVGLHEFQLKGEPIVARFVHELQDQYYSHTGEVLDLKGATTL
jgi:hypothetical protein